MRPIGSTTEGEDRRASWNVEKRTRTYWTLVRSVRIGRRVIQQTVAHLGELDEQGRFEARALSRALIGTPEQSALFDDDQDYESMPLVRLKAVRNDAPCRPSCVSCDADTCGESKLTRRRSEIALVVTTRPNPPTDIA